jgi:hypothetical protein
VGQATVLSIQLIKASLINVDRPVNRVPADLSPIGIAGAWNGEAEWPMK